MDTSLYLLFRAIREHSTVALSGESADEVFGGYRWFHDPDAVRGRHLPVARRGARPATTASCLLDHGLRTARPRRRTSATATAEALAEVPRLPGETGHERRMREICYLHLTRFVRILLDRKDRMSMAVGLEVRVPFCDHRLVEYVFNTPWAMKTFDGREKSLLRAAVADLLPAVGGAAAQEPVPRHVLAGPRQGRTGRPATGCSTAAPPPGPAAGPPKVRELASGRTEMMTMADNLHLLLPLVEVDRWMRTYDVTMTS